MTFPQHRLVRHRRYRALAGVSAAALILAACSPGEPSPEQTTGPDVSALTQRPSQVFGNTAVNPYTVDIASAPVDPNSRYYMDDIRGQIAGNGGLVPINTEHFNSSFVVADASTPRVRLGFNNCQDKPGTPPGLYDGPAFFDNVPVPAAAMPAKGSDGALAIWDPASNQVWEFWQMSKDSAGNWSACWGGRIDNVSSSDGTFPNPFGASASGLVTVGSMITLAEAQAGSIQHAMSIGLKAIKQEQVVAPANRTDGTSAAASAPPMGTRLRLDPKVNVDSLNLTPLGKAVAKAAQQYGFIVAETSGTVAVGAESGQAIEAQTGKDPWEPLLHGVPYYEQLRNFPWDKVQVIQLGYLPQGATAPATEHVSLPAPSGS